MPERSETRESLKRDRHTNARGRSALNKAKASLKTPAQLETEAVEANLLMAGVAVLGVTCLIMIGVAYMLGARFDLVFEDAVKFVGKLLFNVEPDEIAPVHEEL